MTNMSENRQASDRASEKQAWTAPELRELDMSETGTFTSVPGSNDGLVDCS